MRFIRLSFPKKFMDITAKLWSFCHILRHDGVDSSDYIEQLTYLLFLKMADESGITVPENCEWKILLSLEGENLKTTYQNILQTLQHQQNILGQIFHEPISRIQNPTNLKKIIDGIESIGWTKLGKDVQGEAFEGLLEKTANEGKKGAGQFFTPRPLIQAIVNVMQPNPLETKGFTIGDVACGTAGFLTVAVEWQKEFLKNKKLTKTQETYITKNAYLGQELVVRPYRLALMNLFLHGVEGNLTLGDSIYTEKTQKESLDCILTNPPFGTRGSLGAPKMRNFKVETSNIQLNFIQHIYEMLKPNGRAAIVLPDSCLTDAKAKELWQILIGEGLCNVHTILRLPRGTFTPYANGVKACVVFLQKGVATENVWVYDARTNIEEVTKSSRRLEYEKHFEDFVNCYGKNPNGNSKRTETQQFEKYSLEQIQEKNYDLSFTKLYIPPPLEHPIYYVDKLIENFTEQLVDLHRLRELLLPKKKDA